MSPEYRPFLPFVLLLYFFNAFMLPHGLLYSALLTPVFLYWLWKQGIRLFIVPLLIFQVLMGGFHWWNGAGLNSLILSNGLFFSAAIAAVTIWRWFQLFPVPGSVFAKLLRWNSLLVMLALLLLPFAFGRALLWYEVPISKGIAAFPRLKLFTYEASFYALLFTPLFLFYFWKMLLGLEKRWLLGSLAIGVPMLLSLSFGVIGGAMLAIVLCFAFYWRSLSRFATFRRSITFGTALTILLFLVLLIVYPHNPVFVRISNIFAGTDTSAKGRLFESFMFAFDLARSKSLLLGAGLGQIKVLAHDLIVNYYKYEGNYAEIVRVPNSMGEWLASFGLVGFMGKISFEIWAFFRFKLYNNYFNLSLFLFVFIYQFTGSFLVNVAEIMVWCTAILTRFPELNVNLKKSHPDEGALS